MPATTRLLTAAILATLALSACKKHDEAAPAAEASAPAAAAPAATPAPAPAAEAPADDSEAAQKQKAIDRALAEQTLMQDPKGQWATTASASSEYKTLISPGSESTERSAMAATGAPDAETPSREEMGWEPEKADAGIEWLELGYAKPVNATEVRIRQIDTPGSIIKIELIDEAGAKHTVWQGRDDTAYEANEFNWLKKSFDKTAFKAKGVRLTLATNAVQGHESIDAVQLIGE